ncbi:Proteinase inhibitor I3, Kunitz legume [Sesbania bispinosa]|nr:Proteinase inhibitor I3, Kunitz legume [Sesbania bispinosa]
MTSWQLHKSITLRNPLFRGQFTKALTGRPPAPEQVIDTSGKKVQAGSKYYIVPVSSSPRVTGIGFGTVDEEDCPLDVAVWDDFKGLPAVFTPVSQKNIGVVIDTDLNIYFPVVTDCDDSTVWVLQETDQGTRTVVVGGVLGNPGSKTIDNWFKIEKYEDAYKLVYCPSVCKSCKFQCGDIGIYENEYGKHLALTKVPLKIRFEQA